MASDIINIIVVGIGGQGVLTAADIMAEAAFAMGYEVKKTEVAGMAQRGGGVTSHVRFGTRVLSPMVPMGGANFLLAFEIAEGMRWVHALGPNGLALVNPLKLMPPVVSIGLYDYPDDPLQTMRLTGVRVIDVDAGAVAREIGDLRLVNTVMLGSIADHLPFPASVLKEQVLARFRARKPTMVAKNDLAFEQGRTLGRWPF